MHSGHCMIYNISDANITGHETSKNCPKMKGTYRTLQIYLLTGVS
jgi:hypothetical protein